MGDGTTTNRTSPVKVGSATWTDVALGTTHSCGIQTGRSMWCWGDNAFEQLGVTGDDRLQPVQVGSLTSWTSVAAGLNTTFGRYSG